MYILYIVFCSFASLSNSSCFVFLFQKKNEKKYCSSYSVFARAFFLLTHTHTFRLQKIKVSRAKIFKKTLSVSSALRAIPAICRSFVVPAAAAETSLPTDPALGNPAESKGKRTVAFSSSAAVVTSSQVGTHVRRCPRLRAASP